MLFSTLQFSLRVYSPSSGCYGGPARNKDTFLAHGPFVTSHSGHAVMSGSTLKTCKGTKPAPTSLGVQERCGQF
jgi:hypothetical protein